VARDIGRNPVSGNYAKIKKPGFSENLGWWREYLGRNPVSGNYAKIKKPGFSENLGWWREISEETRFLGITQRLRNRVSQKI
jgi:hypothetical protein